MPGLRPVLTQASCIFSAFLTWPCSSWDMFGTETAETMPVGYSMALLLGKCPRCRQGDMFSFPVTRLTRFNVMNQKCPHCGVLLEPEPGYYQGAMYVGYGITVACITLIGLFLFALGVRSEWVYIGIVIGFMLLIAPLNYRYSRIIYLYLFGGIKFDPRYSQ